MWTPERPTVAVTNGDKNKQTKSETQGQLTTSLYNGYEIV